MENFEKTDGFSTALCFSEFVFSYEWSVYTCPAEFRRGRAAGTTAERKEARSARRSGSGGHVKAEKCLVPSNGNLKNLFSGLIFQWAQGQAGAFLFFHVGQLDA